MRYVFNLNESRSMRFAFPCSMLIWMSCNRIYPVYVPVGLSLGFLSCNSYPANVLVSVPPMIYACETISKVCTIGVVFAICFLK